MIIDEINLDGYIDPKGIIYIGKAYLQDDGKWHILSNINSNLC